MIRITNQRARRQNRRTAYGIGILALALHVLVGAAIAVGAENGWTGLSGKPVSDCALGQTLSFAPIAGAGLRPAPAHEHAAMSFSVGGGGYIKQDNPPPSGDDSDQRMTAPPDSTFHLGDSLRHQPTTLGPPTPDSGARRHARPPSPGGFFRSPTGTLLKSVAFPGWGQWSNGKKQKAAVYFGIETYFLTKALIWRHRASDRLSVWERTDHGDVAALQAAFNSYDSARNSRNYFYWLTGITAFISMFDAYADSYLLTLERTRKMGDDYWGGQARFAPDDEMRLAVAWQF